MKVEGVLHYDLMEASVQGKEDVVRVRVWQTQSHVLVHLGI